MPPEADFTTRDRARSLRGCKQSWQRPRSWAAVGGSTGRSAPAPTRPCSPPPTCARAARWRSSSCTRRSSPPTVRRGSACAGSSRCWRRSSTRTSCASTISTAPTAVRSSPASSATARRQRGWPSCRRPSGRGRCASSWPRWPARSRRCTDAGSCTTTSSPRTSSPTATAPRAWPTSASRRWAPPPGACAGRSASSPPRRCSVAPTRARTCGRSAPPPGRCGPARRRSPPPASRSWCARCSRARRRLRRTCRPAWLR